MVVAAVLALVGALLCPGHTEPTAYTFSGGAAGAAIVVDRASHQEADAGGVDRQGDAHAVADRDADQWAEYAGTPPRHGDHSCGPGGMDLLGVQPPSASVPGLDSVPAAAVVVAAWSAQSRPPAAAVGVVRTLAGAELLVRVGVSRR